MSALYPPIEPFDQFRLPVSDLHELHVERAGTPEGKPVVVLHGGPGGGVLPVYRRVFDPERYHIILFDQRGCGLSTPRAELRENTTWDLVADIERIRTDLGIARWQVFGGSWGGTLALAYAQAHPDHVSEIVLRGPCLWQDKEFHWMFQDGADKLYPDEWARFAAHVLEPERDDLISAYYRRLTDPDPAVQSAAARAWGRWESSRLALTVTDELDTPHLERYDAAMSLLECHYMVNRAWLSHDAQLLDGLAEIQHVPGLIICGRYDAITPVATSWEIAQAWPAAKLIIVPAAGHAFHDPPILTELIQATDRFADRY